MQAKEAEASVVVAEAQLRAVHAALTGSGSGGGASVEHLAKQLVRLAEGLRESAEEDSQAVKQLQVEGSGCGRGEANQ